MKRRIVVTSLFLGLGLGLMTVPNLPKAISSPLRARSSLAQTQPTLSIGDVTVTEGDSGTVNAVFTITLSTTLFRDWITSVDYTTVDGTATTADNDYTPRSGSVGFPIGDGSASLTISVPIAGDTRGEGNETFFVNLRNARTNPEGAVTIADGQGVCTIVDDDSAAVPALSLNDVSLIEGNTGTVDAVFVVSLSGAVGTDVTVNFATADGTATVSDNDYSSRLGTVTFPAGDNSPKTIAVPVTADTTPESDETFFVNLASPVGATIADGQGLCTIVNDDAAPLPALSISDTRVLEGDDPNTNAPGTIAAFVVTLSASSNSDITVNYTTHDGLATVSDNDYIPQSGTLRFPPNTTRQIISIRTVGDTRSENFGEDEFFFVNLSDPVGAVIGDGEGRCTIVEDENPIHLFTLSISDGLLLEGNSGAKNMEFTVTVTPMRDGDDHGVISVSYSTSDGPSPAGAQSPSDYSRTSGVLRFPRAESSSTVTIAVPIIGDTLPEPDEIFYLNVGDVFPDGFDRIVIVDGEGVGTIRDDDNGCVFLLDRTSQTVIGTGRDRSFSVQVKTTGECSWTAISAADWITISRPLGIVFGGHFLGDAQVVIDVAENTGPPRTGTLIIAGTSFTVYQEARNPCTYRFSRSGDEFPASGGTGRNEVTTLDSCVWELASRESWISVNAQRSGSGSLSYTIAPNNGPARTGTLSIRGGAEAFSVNQAAPQGCQYQIQPGTSASISSDAYSGQIRLTTGTGECHWTAVSDSPWIAITSPASGAGDSLVTYTVEPNPGHRRSGTLTIAGFRFDVFQFGQRGCPPTLFPNREEFGARGGASILEVSAPDDCKWTATTNEPWILIEHGDPLGQQQGFQQLNYFVRPNTSATARTGTINVGGSALTVSQTGVPSACVQAISPPSATLKCCAPIGQVVALPSAEVKVTAAPDCVWDPVPLASWLEIVDASSQTGNRLLKGNGTFVYQSGFNSQPGAVWRSGLIDVGGKQHSAYQDGANGLCVMELFCSFFPSACGDAPALLSESRAFRDQVLAKSQRGKHYTELYYKFSSEAAGILLVHPMLVLRSRDVLDRYMPVLQAMSRGEQVSLTDGDIEEIDSFLRAIGERGSSGLRDSVNALCDDLHNPEVHTEFNVIVREGKKREVSVHSQSRTIHRIGRASLGFGSAFGIILLFGVRRRSFARNARGKLGRCLPALARRSNFRGVLAVSSRKRSTTPHATVMGVLVVTLCVRPCGAGFAHSSLEPWTTSAPSGEAVRKFDSWQPGQGELTSASAQQSVSELLCRMPPSPLSQRSFVAFKPRNTSPDTPRFPADRLQPQTSNLLGYSTYFGGRGNEEGNAIASDPAGNIYIAGFTDSPNFPLANASQSSLAGGQDAFIAKLDPTATKLFYSTYLGGSGQDNATAIAVDAEGNAYVTGFTNSSDFPVREAAQPTKRGEFNAFITKLDPSGAILKSTFFGGSVSDYGSSIAIDDANNVYLAGLATSPNLPTVNAIQPSNGGFADAYIAKVDLAEGRIVYATYFGGNGIDGASNAIVDRAGNVYVTGLTSSSNLPMVNPLQPAYGGGIFDAFVAKINSSGTKIIYSTYLGGAGQDRALRIAIDSSGNAFVTGDTDSTDFPLSNALQRFNGGGSDAFVTKINAAGNRLIYSSYLGGSGSDGGTAISTDSAGSACITGFTASTNFPVVNAVQPNLGGAYDCFVAKINSAGSTLAYSTYLGGSGIDSAFAVIGGASGAWSLMGVTSSTDFPIVSAWQGANGGGTADLFIAQLAQSLSINSAAITGKDVIVTGSGFDYGATLLINGQPQRSRNDAVNPASMLIGKKSAKSIARGQTVTLEVRNPDGLLSNQFAFTRP